MKSLPSSFKLKKDSMYNFFSQTDEIKEDPHECEGDAGIEKFLNLNLCQSEGLEMEKNNSEACTSSVALNSDSLDTRLNLKPRNSQGLKNKKKKKKLRRGTIVNPDIFSGPKVFKDLLTVKSSSPITKVAKEKSKFITADLLGGYKASSADKQSDGNDIFNRWPTSSPDFNQKESSIPKARIMKMISSLQEIEKNM